MRSMGTGVIDFKSVLKFTSPRSLRPQNLMSGCSFGLRLQMPRARIMAAAREQFLMAAAFNELAFHHDANEMCAHRDAQPVRYDYGGPADCDQTKPVEPVGFAPRVHHARWLVQQQNIAVAQKRA